MIPKQGESENTGGKRIKKKSIGQKEEGRKKKKGGEGRKKYSCFLFLLLYSLFQFFSFCFILFVHFLVFCCFFLKNLTPDIPRSIHFGSPRTMKKFSCLSYSSSSTILTLTVFL